jgi:CheY-like chemotaxis protein
MTAELRVLHVDDDPDQLSLARRRFETTGRTVVTADGPVAGLDRLDRLDRLDAGVDCLVSDSMVTPDGEPFVVAARRRVPDLPVVAYTGAPLDAVPVEAGVAGYVRKGAASVGRLCEVVDAAVARPAGEGWVVVARHDGDDGELVETVAPALAAVEGCRVDDLDTLFDVVDLEAAEDLLRSVPPASRAVGAVSFVAGSRDVRLGADGSVAVRPRPRQRRGA